MNLINFEYLKELLGGWVFQVGAVVFSLWAGTKVLKFVVVGGSKAIARRVLYWIGWRKLPPGKEEREVPYYEGRPASSAENYKEMQEYYALGKRTAEGKIRALQEAMNRQYESNKNPVTPKWWSDKFPSASGFSASSSSTGYDTAANMPPEDDSEE